MKTSLETPSKVPHLSADQAERLAFLSGECAEVIKAITKIQRHGYFAYDPTNRDVMIDRDGEAHPDNKDDLETEIGHVFCAIQMMTNGGDLTNMNIHSAKNKKLGTVKRWMHHQNESIYDAP